MLGDGTEGEPGIKIFLRSLHDVLDALGALKDGALKVGEVPAGRVLEGDNDSGDPDGFAGGAEPLPDCETKAAIGGPGNV